MSNCLHVKDDIVLIVIEDKERTSDLLTLDLETEETFRLLNLDNTMKLFDIVRVPGAGHPFYLVHLSNSLLLLEPLRHVS